MAKSTCAAYGEYIMTKLHVVGLSNSLFFLSVRNEELQKYRKLLFSRMHWPPLKGRAGTGIPKKSMSPSDPNQRVFCGAP